MGQGASKTSTSTPTPTAATYGTTFIVFLLIFALSSVLGLLYGIKSSIQEKVSTTDNDSFTYGISVMAILVGILVLAWTVMEGERGGSYFYVFASVVIFAVAGVGFGGMMGYKNALQNPKDNKFQYGLFLLPVVTLVASFYLHNMAFPNASTHPFILFLLSLMYFVIFAQFYQSAKFVDDTDTHLYWGYTWAMMGLGVTLFLLTIPSLWKVWSENNKSTTTPNQ